jgi:hypothetical protein
MVGKDCHVTYLPREEHGTVASYPNWRDSKKRWGRVAEQGHIEKHLNRRMRDVARQVMQIRW